MYWLDKPQLPPPTWWPGMAQNTMITMAEEKLIWDNLASFLSNLVTVIGNSLLGVERNFHAWIGAKLTGLCGVRTQKGWHCEFLLSAHSQHIQFYKGINVILISPWFSIVHWKLLFCNLKFFTICILLLSILPKECSPTECSLHAKCSVFCLCSRPSALLAQYLACSCCSKILAE